MYETTGALTIAMPSALLVLVAIPLLWSLGVVTAGARKPLVTRIAIAGAGGGLAYACLLAWRLASVARGHVLGEHVSSILRVAELDLAFDLVLDPAAAVGALLVTLVAFVSVLHAVWGGHADRRLASSGLLTAGALLVLLADGMAPLLAGLGISTLGALAVARGASGRAATSSALAADACVVMALLFLFWSLGGAFGAGGIYEADSAPRFVLVARDGPPIGPKPVLSMTTHPGAIVSVDDGPPLPAEPLRAPFEVPVEPTVYTFRIKLGGASEELVVPHVSLAPGRSYTLAPYGPTASLRSILDQVRVPAPGRKVLAARRIAGLPASLVIAVLLAAALAGRVLVLASRRGGSSLAVAIEVIVPAFLALRLAPLFDPRGADGAALAMSGAAAAIVASGHAAAPGDAGRSARSVLAAAGAIVIAAAGLGEIAGGLCLVVPAVLAASAVLAALDARRDVRWLGVACAAGSGLLPEAGTSSGIAVVLARAMTPSATWRGSGIVVAVAIVAALAICSLALFRIAASPGRQSDGTRGEGTIAVLLAATALGSGVILGAATSPFGGRVPPLAARILRSVDVPSSIAASWLGLALGVAAAAAGLSAARRGGPISALALVAGRASRAVAHAGLLVGRMAWVLARGAVALDRLFLADVAEVLGRFTLATARGLVAGERAIERRALGDGTAVRAALPSTSRAATGAVFVMVALLGLVVLSSLLLGCLRPS